MAKRDEACKGRVKRPEVRVCGDCEACCHVLRITELAKESWTPCEHQESAKAIVVPEHLRKRGCDIYDTRPAECKHFKCAWLSGAFGPFHGIPAHLLRPDRLKLILFGLGNTVWGQMLVAAEIAQGGFDNPMALYVVEQLSRLDLLLVAQARGKRRLVGPPKRMEWAAGIAERAVASLQQDTPPAACNAKALQEWQQKADRVADAVSLLSAFEGIKSPPPTDH